MVKLTTDYIESKWNRITCNKSFNKKFKKDALWKITHLHMGNMFIDGIGNFAACKNLKVIYLQHNVISKIENLYFASFLTHLHLQHNQIKKIENLDLLQNLEKLYLGYNYINIVEGLENLKKLNELHIENQNLHFGESLCFEPRSLSSLSTSLKILDISNNKLTTLKDILNFDALEILEARNNLITNITDLSEVISTLNCLKKLFLQGNAVTRQFRYRESIIANSNTLVDLDDKYISEICRNFMKRFKIETFHRYTTKKKSNMTIRDDITSSLNLPPEFKRSISRAIFQNTGPKLAITVTSACGETQSHVFPPWISASTIKTTKNNHFIPRPFWRNINKGKQSHVMSSVICSKTVTLPQI